MPASASERMRLRASGSVGSVITRLPLDLRWEVEPRSWTNDGQTVAVDAAGGTDNFVDPAGSAAVVNGARALTLAPPAPWRFSAKVTVDFAARFDAGVLLLWIDERHFAKLCFERSPQGDPMVVAVVTRGESDDSNGWVVADSTAWLRITAVTSDVYAFHAGTDGETWQLARYFRLRGRIPARFGISAQSPTGSGCTASFSHFALSRTGLDDLRDGS